MVTSPHALLATCLSFLYVCIIAIYFRIYFKKRDTQPLSFSDILVFLNKVYLTAFLKLIDPLEEAYLRQRHTRIEFRKLQSLRIQQAREYFRKMVANAVVLQTFAYRH